MRPPELSEETRLGTRTRTRLQCAKHTRWP